MKTFDEIDGVEDFVKSYQEYEKKFIVEGSTFAGGWQKYVLSFLKANFPKTKFTSKCKVATIQPGISFDQIEKFAESIQNFKIDEIVHDNVTNSFTFYGSKK